MPPLLFGVLVFVAVFVALKAISREMKRVGSLLERERRSGSRPERAIDLVRDSKTGVYRAQRDPR